MAFHGKVAIVTGAGSGMGRLAAQRLQKAGAQVAAVDVNEAGLVETARDHEGILVQPVDVTDERATADLVAKVESELGHIDRIMNCAAIMPTALLKDQDAGLVNRIMDINYGGTVNITQAALPNMLRRGKGDIVNFASIAGWLPAPHFGAYNASKFAVVAYTEVLAMENRKSGLRFACVCPPPVATPLLDQAKSQPKALEGLPPIPPEKVLDEIEKCLEKGKLWVFPDATSAITWRIRRLFPDLAWSQLLKREGL